MRKESSKLISPIQTLFLVGTLLFTSTIFSSFNTSSQVFAQPMPPYEINNSYDDNNNYVPSSYSEYPTKENKYECRTGPFEGFFVSSVEFCKRAPIIDGQGNVMDTKDRTGTIDDQTDSTEISGTKLYTVIDNTTSIQ